MSSYQRPFLSSSSSSSRMVGNPQAAHNYNEEDEEELDDGNHTVSDICTVPDDIQTLTSAGYQNHPMTPSGGGGDANTYNDDSLFTVENTNSDVFDRYRSPNANLGRQPPPAALMSSSAAVVVVEDPPGTGPPVSFIGDNSSAACATATNHTNHLQHPPLLSSTANTTTAPYFRLDMAVPTMPTEEEEDDDEEQGDRNERQSLPGMIILGTAGDDSKADTPSTAVYRNPKQLQDTTTDDDDEDDDDGEYESMWKQKICGCRADRLVILLLLILFASVAVIVAAIILSEQSIWTSSSSSSEAANGGGTAEEETKNAPSDSIRLTRTPRGSPTAAPVVAPWDPACGVDDEQKQFRDFDDLPRDCAWLRKQGNAISMHCQKNTDGNAYNICIETCQNTEQCPDNETTLAPDNDGGGCGGDAGSTGFFEDDQGAQKSCAWLAEQPKDILSDLCKAGAPASVICRETCQLCAAEATTETVAPTSLAPTEPPTLAITETPTLTPTAAVTETPSSAPTSAVSTTSPTITASTPLPILATEAPTTESTIAATLDATTASTTDLLSLITSATALSVDDLNNDSPQASAYRWLQDGLDQGSVADTASSSLLLQKFAIATFGYSADVGSGWMDNFDECSWSGITCNESTIREINLDSSNLSGNYPSELSLLRDSLETLIVSNNEMTGSIPDSFGRLRNLQVWQMESNTFSGTIPATIGGLQQLRIWYFERNPDIEGSFPDEITQLVNLEELTFYYTGISGALPEEVCEMENLDVLVLDCRLVETECWTRCFYRCGGETGVPC